jgi:hypothetical protein
VVPTSRAGGHGGEAGTGSWERAGPSLLPWAAETPHKVVNTIKRGCLDVGGPVLSTLAGRPSTKLFVKSRDSGKINVGSGQPVREVPMRLPIFSLFLIAAALLGESQTASAQSPTSYPWCARYYKDSAPTSCYFSSYQQCRASVSGVGGLCFQSPYYHATPVSVQPRHRRTYRS